MINHDDINLPWVVAEVTAAFYRYEDALVSNNIAVLDELFWHDKNTVRLGAGENLYGIDEIRAFRAARASAGLARTLRHTVITTSGRIMPCAAPSLPVKVANASAASSKHGCGLPVGGGSWRRR